MQEPNTGARAEGPSAKQAYGGRSLSPVRVMFLLGPGFVVGVGNGLILGHPMYRSRLVPRRTLGLYLTSKGFTASSPLFDDGRRGARNGHAATPARVVGGDAAPLH